MFTSWTNNQRKIRRLQEQLNLVEQEREVSAASAVLQRQVRPRCLWHLHSHFPEGFMAFAIHARLKLSLRVLGFLARKASNRDSPN